MRVAESDAALRPIQRLVDTLAAIAQPMNSDLSSEWSVLRRRLVPFEGSDDSPVVIGIDSPRLERPPCVLGSWEIDPEEAHEPGASTNEIDVKRPEWRSAVASHPVRGQATPPESDVVERLYEILSAVDRERLLLGVDENPSVGRGLPRSGSSVNRCDTEANHEHTERHHATSSRRSSVRKTGETPHPYKKSTRRGDVKVGCAQREERVPSGQGRHPFFLISPFLPSV